MREMDRREIYNMRGHDNPFQLAREIVLAATYGRAGIAERSGRPCGIIGVSPMWPGLWSAWSFGTDDWPKAVMELSRYGRSVLEPFVRARGAHRVQCESHIDHIEAHRWLMAMGATVEGRLRAYGRDGSDYLQFSWGTDYVHRKAARSKARAGTAVQG